MILFIYQIQKIIKFIIIKNMINNKQEKFYRKWFSGKIYKN